MPHILPSYVSTGIRLVLNNSILKWVGYLLLSRKFNSLSNAFRPCQHYYDHRLPTEVLVHKRYLLLLIISDIIGSECCFSVLAFRKLYDFPLTYINFIFQILSYISSSKDSLCSAVTNSERVSPHRLQTICLRPFLELPLLFRL